MLCLFVIYADEKAREGTERTYVALFWRRCVDDDDYDGGGRPPRRGRITILVLEVEIGPVGAGGTVGEEHSNSAFYCSSHFPAHSL
ncbi:hypothetical protein RB195_006296 [Necator americanus]|uniref:Secreted protein n=1 Tax=Necator americanus TaxID=51031 RepID=A0ABR1BVQ6_NECAM